MARKAKTKVAASTADDETPLMTGKASLFRGKVRKPVTLTLTQEHHDKMDRAERRLRESRSDVFGLLIELYADTLTRADVKAIRQRAT